MNFTTPKPISISDTMKKGSNEGKTISHHIFNPLMDASTDSWGNEINEMAIKVTESARVTVFTFERNTDKPPSSCTDCETIINNDKIKKHLHLFFLRPFHFFSRYGTMVYGD